MIAIKFKPRSEKIKKVSKKNNPHYGCVMSSIRKRPTLQEKEENRKKYGMKKPQRKVLNKEVLIRITSKVHELQCHSPEKIRIKTKQMWLRWIPKFDRKASCAYINKYSLHKL